jgi:leucyl aminopeptidase
LCRFRSADRLDGFPNSGSFAVPRDVSIFAAADLTHQSTTCIIEVVQKDASKSESHPKVQHADGQPLRISVSKSSDMRACLGQALQLAAQFKANASIALSFGDQTVSDSDAATAAEVVTVHAYSPSTWKKVGANQRPVVQSCAILGASAHAVLRGSEVGAAINMARRLGDLPPNVATPAYMASHAIQLCDPSHSAPAALTCTVLDEKDCAGLGMNLLLAVGSGSSNPPRIIALEHCPPGLEASQPVLLVGKGVTFDSGGIRHKTERQNGGWVLNICVCLLFCARELSLESGNEMGHVRCSHRLHAFASLSVTS